MALAVLLVSGTADAAPPSPSAAIVAPADGAATSARSLAVDVRFAAAAGDAAPLATGNVHTVVLTLDGAEVGRFANPRWVKEGVHRFEVALDGAAEGRRVLRAVAYQGARQAELHGTSAPVEVTLDRTPPELAVTSPADGSFVRDPAVQVRGTVGDALSGVASVECAGQPVAAAATFTCRAELAEGTNELVVRVLDRAGNAGERRLSVDHQPGGLGGQPGQAALEAVEDVLDAGASVASDEISEGAVRTQLELTFARHATVAEVNGLLRRLRGTIVSQREGVLIAVVRIPDPGSLEALDALLAELADEPVLRAARETTMPDLNTLPQHVGQGAAGLLQHHLAVRAHAAWNAAGALGSGRPTLVVGDEFGGGPPSGEEFTVLDAGDFAANAPGRHGYFMLGIAAGAFDGRGAAGPVDAVTGLFPGKLPLRAADLAGFQWSIPTMEDVLLERIEEAAGDVVLNTSMSGWPCNTAAEAERNCTVERATAAALSWIGRVRGTDPSVMGENLEPKFVHTASAGNVRPAVGPLGAMVNSPWTAAALRSGLVDPDTGQAVPNLANTLVVENASATGGGDDPFRPVCPAPTSELGGTIAGVGMPAHSFDRPDSAATVDDGGTSSASAQVAGLAAYTWALRPGVTPAALVALLRRTARPDAGGCNSAGVIDAYAAVLTADESLPTRFVRMAIFDVADGSGSEGADGAFDRRDLHVFAERLDTADGAVDYGRYDLNGDGATGQSDQIARSDRFDLDADGHHGHVQIDVEGLRLGLDETSLRDWRVLCGAAYSSLYATSDADTAARDELLGLERCLDLGLEAEFPAAVQRAQATPLTVRTLDLDLPDGGSFTGQPGVHLELTPTGGSVGDSTGMTDAEGVFRTHAELAAGEPELRIEIVARAQAGGEELARETVRAFAMDGPPPPPPVFDGSFSGLYEGTFRDTAGNVSRVSKNTGLVNIGEFELAGRRAVWVQMPPGFGAGTATCFFEVAPAGMRPEGGAIEGPQRFCLLTRGIDPVPEPPMFSLTGTVGGGRLSFQLFLHGDFGPQVIGTLDLTECYFFNTVGLSPLCSF